MAGQATATLRKKGFRNAFMLMPGPGDGGVEHAMKKAGFLWYRSGELLKFDSSGNVTQKIKYK